MEATGNALAGLAGEIEGQVVSAADTNWDEARQAWNLMADQRPAAVVLAAGARDVAATVSRAKEAGLRVTGQGTGHGAVAMGHLADTVLVKTQGLTDIQIDPDRGTATIGAGVIWRDLLNAASPHKLAGMAGSSPDVGVVGYSLGGGLGWLGRRHGFACNRVAAATLVTADGESRRVDPDSEPDLFWAIRGGGGSFGIVTELELDMVPVGDVYAGSLILPADDADQVREVFRAYRDWARQMPDEVTSIGRIITPPPIPDVPEPLRGRTVITLGLCFIGSAEEGRELVAPLRELGEPIMDLIDTMPAAQLVTVHMDPEQPVPGLVEHTMLGELEDDSIDAFVEAAGPGSESPLLFAELRHLGGAFGRAADDAGALSHLEGEFVLNAVGLPMAPEQIDPITQGLDDLCSTLEPWSNGGCYFNFAERPTEAARIFAADTLQRLSEIKSKWDPEGRIRANHEIPAMA
jgi:hypothetical protein